ncbi:MAG: threonine-phosphate decarboxylase CobD [Halanaerobiales bacterium]|nr:threonine-phosphate decarboxylase CobD [Halanaerobiales bacterium]
MEQKHGGNIENIAEKYNIHKENIIDFSVNINFVGPPPDVYSRLKNELESITRYPEVDSKTLKKKLANKYGFEKDNYIIGNGAVELIYILVKVLKPKQSLVYAPTFSEYEKALRTVYSQINYHYLKRGNKFKLDIEELKADLTDEIDLFFLCNPNNPTGDFISKEEVKQILKHNEKHNIFTIIDEAFVDFLDRNISAISLLKKYDKIFILRSLTKFFAIPGLRLGFGIGKQGIIDKMNGFKDPWNVNILAQKAGEIILNQDEYIKLTKKAIYKEKLFLYQELKKIEKIEVYYPNANYIFIDLKNSGYNSTAVYEKLAKKGILIRNCRNYRGLDDNYIRIAVKSREDNKKLLNRLKSFLIINN